MPIMEKHKTIKHVFHIICISIHTPNFVPLQKQKNVCALTRHVCNAKIMHKCVRYMQREKQSVNDPLGVSSILTQRNITNREILFLENLLRCITLCMHPNSVFVIISFFCFYRKRVFIKSLRFFSAYTGKITFCGFFFYHLDNYYYFHFFDFFITKKNFFFRNTLYFL